MFDVVTFGSATVDIFVESDRAHVVNIRGIEGELDLYCLKYGAFLIEIEMMSEIKNNIKQHHPKED